MAASRADVAQWLTHVGYKVYVPTLMHLDGAALLLRARQASLTAAGVVPHHVVPLLACIGRRQRQRRRARAAAAHAAHGGTTGGRERAVAARGSAGLARRQAPDVL